MIINSTLGAAELDVDKPVGIPYHGRIDLQFGHGDAAIDLPGGNTHTYPFGDHRDIPHTLKHRYLRGTQVFKIRSGAPKQTADQRAAGQRFTDYAVIHSFATNPPKALIGGAVVENGSFIYHSPVSGNWLVGVSGDVSNNQATVNVTLTPFGVIGEDARKPVSVELHLNDAGQRDADSKPIGNVRKDFFTGKLQLYPETDFLVTFHTASHDGQHASLAVVVARPTYITNSDDFIIDEQYTRYFAVGWLALELHDPEAAKSTAAPEPILCVQFDRVQTMGLRFKDEHTGAELRDQAWDQGGFIITTRPSFSFLTDGTQEVTRADPDPNYDDLRADLTTQYIISQKTVQRNAPTLRGHDKRIVDLWYLPGEHRPIPIRLTNYFATSREYDDICTANGSQRDTWSYVWVEKDGFRYGDVYLDSVKTASASGIWQLVDIDKNSTVFQVLAGEVPVLQKRSTNLWREGWVRDYSAQVHEEFHGYPTVLPTFKQLPTDAAAVKGFASQTKIASSEPSGTPFRLDNFDLGFSSAETQNLKDYIFAQTIDIGNEPLALAFLIDRQYTTLTWPGFDMLPTGYDARVSQPETSFVFNNGDVILQSATFPVRDDPPNQTPLVFVDPPNTLVSLLCI